MTNRTALSSAFLARAGWAGAKRSPLAGDASDRRYERILKDTGESAVLMDVGPIGGDSLRPFIKIADHLKRIGLSAPEIRATDLRNGFLLLEDFGDNLFAVLMLSDPAIERALYEEAIDLLVHLHRAPLPDRVSEFRPRQMAEFAAIAYEWYDPDPHSGSEKVCVAELTRLLSMVATNQPVLALRDFHSENLIWLPERTGTRRVGLLDFQDAFLCHPAYDLVSLLRDARRDRSPGLAQPLIDRYVQVSGCDSADLHLALAVYGAQRNLRIVGIFARLCRMQGKPHYIDLIPRVWRHLLTDLAHPDLEDLRRIVLADLPEPTNEFLNTLKAKCATTPHP
ncbi:MAG: phosphotransferase [Paracoccaceae bacterium]